MPLESGISHIKDSPGRMVVLTTTVRTMELEFHAKTEKVPWGLDFTGPLEDAPLKPDSFKWT